jgi:pimeloyl-ACP methyl ester carboxylesterase
MRVSLTTGLAVAATLAITSFALLKANDLSFPSMEECSISPAPNGFRREVAEVNGAMISYIIGGNGPPLILIHGFPEDHTAWEGVVAELASQFTILVPDMRGIGRSRSPAGGPFDALTLSEDVRALAAQQNLDRPFVVGHDMGGIVAYVLARAHPDAVSGAMLIENPLPGIAPWDEIAADPRVWHINFHQAEATPELLIAGREGAYFRRQFFMTGMDEPALVDDRELRGYACAYRKPDQLAAGLGQYRATPQNADFIGAHGAPTGIPLILVAAEQSLGPAMPAMAQALRQRGWSDISLELSAGRSHYMLDEHPRRVAALIREHALQANDAHAPRGLERAP